MFNVTAVVLKEQPRNKMETLCHLLELPSARQVKSVPLGICKFSTHILFLKNYKHN